MSRRVRPAGFLQSCSGHEHEHAIARGAGGALELGVFSLAQVDYLFEYARIALREKCNARRVGFGANNRPALRGFGLWSGGAFATPFYGLEFVCHNLICGLGSFARSEERRVG